MVQQRRRKSFLKEITVLIALPGVDGCSVRGRCIWLDLIYSTLCMRKPSACLVSELNLQLNFSYELKNTSAFTTPFLRKQCRAYCLYIFFPGLSPVQASQVIYLRETLGESLKKLHSLLRTKPSKDRTSSGLAAFVVFRFFLTFSLTFAFSGSLSRD